MTLNKEANMRRFILSAAIVPALALLSACTENTEDSNVTETRMDDLDSLEGTISDDMINTDQSTDEAPVDAAPVTAAPVEGEKTKAKLDKVQATESGGPDIVKITPDDVAE
jgi:hypothetical protein